MSRIIDTNETNFDADVLASVPVLVDFYSPTCGPCRAMVPILEELTEELAGRAKVVKVNVGENSPLAQRFRITAVPTFLVVKNGQVATRLVGMQSKYGLLDALGSK
jgi:thioredoxin